MSTSFTPFVRPNRSIITHNGYGEHEVGRIPSHVCKVPEKGLFVSNLARFTLVVTIRLYAQGSSQGIKLLDNHNLFFGQIYTHESKLTLLAGDYLTVQALDQQQPDCLYTTGLFWDELMMT